MLHFSFFYMEESGQVFFFFFNFPFFFSVEAELDIGEVNIRKKDQYFSYFLSSLFHPVLD